MKINAKQKSVMGGWAAGRRRPFILPLILAGILLCPGWTKGGSACADQTAEASILREEGWVADTGDEAAGFRTPLAGEALHAVFLGIKIDLSAFDRNHVSALVLGGEFYSPEQGGTFGIPLGGIYLKRVWEHSRTRNIICLFSNDLEYDRSFGNLDLVTRFENNTLPVGRREVVNNEEIKSSEAKWGTVIASMGPGLRYKIAPFQVDNDLRLQLLGKVGYFYTKRTDDTGPNLVLPPSTMLYGGKLRGRYDGMRRNLLELPHTGMAAGFDLDYIHRDKWSNFGTSPDAVFKRSDTRDYLQFNGYFMGVGKFPGLSERNRILFSFHGGTTPKNNADRYNAITIGGGPLPGESDDLFRPDYPGTTFNQVLVSDYALAALQYRRALTPFLYLHLRETFIWAKRATVTDANKFLFKSSDGLASTIGLDTGFFWNSALYLGYSYDSSFIRNGKSGSNLIITWSKLF